MSKRSRSGDQNSEWSLEDLEKQNISIDENDFGFLIDNEGNLKTIFGGEDQFEDPPENVVKILAIFGIVTAKNLSRVGITIH